PNLPLPCPFSSASFTFSGLPPKSFPFSSAMAAFASSSLSRSTKANPRERPVSLSVMILTERTVRLSPSISCLICASVVSKGRLPRSEEHTSELQSRGHLVCRLLLEKKKKKNKQVFSLQKTRKQTLRTSRSVKST